MGRAWVTQGLTAFLAATWLSLGAAVPDGPEQLGMQPLVDTWRLENNIPGLVVAIAFPDGSAEIATSGLANIEMAKPVRTDTQFRCCSLTKVLMACVTLELDELGYFSLDDPARMYVSEDNYFLSLSDYSDDITIRNLLQHSSGIPDPTQSIENLLTRSISFLSSGLTLTDVPNEAVSSLEAFPPGARVRYSNPGYLLLGDVLEGATGQDLATLLDEYVCSALSLQNMGLDSGTQHPDLADGYKVIDGELHLVSRYEGGGLTRSAGAAVSDVGDLLAFANALFRQDLLTNEQWLAMTDWKPIDQRGGGEEYGLGLMHRQLEGRETIGHRGESMGFRAEMLYLPADDVILLVLANSGEAELLELADALLTFHGL